MRNSSFKKCQKPFGEGKKIEKMGQKLFSYFKTICEIVWLILYLKQNVINICHFPGLIFLTQFFCFATSRRKYFLRKYPLEIFSMKSTLHNNTILKKYVLIFYSFVIIIVVKGKGIIHFLVTVLVSYWIDTV